MTDRRIDVAGTVAYIVIASIGGALTPRLAHVLRWPRRARGKALFAYWLWCTAFTYTVRYVIAASFHEGAELHRQAAADLRAELGREPTPEEVGAAFSARWARRKGFQPRG